MQLAGLFTTRRYRPGNMDNKGDCSPPHHREARSRLWVQRSWSRPALSSRVHNPLITPVIFQVSPPFIPRLIERPKTLKECPSVNPSLIPFTDPSSGLLRNQEIDAQEKSSRRVSATTSLPFNEAQSHQKQGDTDGRRTTARL